MHKRYVGVLLSDKGIGSSVGTFDTHAEAVSAVQAELERGGLGGVIPVEIVTPNIPDTLPEPEPVEGRAAADESDDTDEGDEGDESEKDDDSDDDKGGK